MITIIVAMDKNRLMGAKNGLPWHIKGDLQHFQKTTLHHTVLMGSHTYFSIGKALPHRKNIVVTNNPDNIHDSNIEIRGDLFEVLNEYQNTEGELFVIGGNSIYNQSFPYTDRVILSKIDGIYEGNAYLKEFEGDFTLVKEIPMEGFSVCYYERVKSYV